MGTEEAEDVAGDGKAIPAAGGDGNGTGRLVCVQCCSTRQIQHPGDLFRPGL